MTSLVVLSDAAEVAARAAKAIVRAASDAIAARGAFRIALAGGTTPRAAYVALVSERVDWSRVHVFFGDERAVPADHADSNFAMANAALFSRVGIPQGQVHRMRADDVDVEAAARDYDEALAEPLDLVLLGMGEDGHTASLFPGSTALGEQTRRVVPIIGPKPPPRRLTITPRVLGEAREVVVLVTGASKAGVLAKALGGPLAIDELPVQLARSGTFLVDRAAASELAPGSFAG